MNLLLNVSIDGLANSQEHEVVEGLCEWLNAKYGRDNVIIDVNDETDYDEEDNEE